MRPEAPAPSSNNAPQGLPPVAPPSGRFIIQLFLVPGLIVAVAVLILLGFKFLLGGTRSPDEFLRDIDNANTDIRWRAASDLAQVLQRPESLLLASDPKFGLDLADRLQAALEDVKKEETETAKQSQGLAKEKQAAAWNKLEPRRDYVLFLTSCLGNLTVPVGADLLCRQAMEDRGSDPRALAKRRRWAVWALAKLGENLKRFEQLSLTERQHIVDTLKEEARGSGARARRAQAALDYILEKKPLHVDEALAACVQPDNDPFLRELVAFALKYWDGDQVIATLVKLSYDQGAGTTVDVGDAD